MKSGRWADPKVKCPFYKYQDAQTIFCKGVEEGNAIHMAFATPEQRKQYEARHCTDCKGYAGCPINVAAMQIYL